MINIENVINKLWRCLNNLRGYLESRTSMRLIKELIFLKLINDQLKAGNRYFTSRINGIISLDDEIQDISKFSDDLKNFIKSNEILNRMHFEILYIEEKVDSKVLIETINVIKTIDTTTEEKASSIFQSFLYMMLGNEKREVATSPSINKLISALLADKNIETLYDPTIGTGMLLLDVASNHDNLRIYGQDINEEPLNTCRMLLILDERIEDLPNIEEGNTLINPGHVENTELKKFDCVVTNPPFSLKDWGYNEIAEGDKFNRFHRGLPSRSLADYAFISHAVESLNDKGIGVMIENTGVLFKEGAEGHIREQMIKENIIDSVIALPNNMMYGTAIPVNLIIFNKCKNTDDILFIDAAKEVQANKVRTFLTNKNIEDIANNYKNRSEIEGISRRVSIKEIDDNKFNLNVSRYIEDKSDYEKIDMDDIEKNINMLTTKLKDVQSKINEVLGN